MTIKNNTSHTGYFKQNMFYINWGKQIFVLISQTIDIWNRATSKTGHDSSYSSGQKHVEDIGLVNVKDEVL